MGKKTRAHGRNNATVLSLGTSFTVGQLLAPLRRIGLLVLMVVLNCALIPALAWGVFKVFGIQDSYVSGAVEAAELAVGP